MFRTSLPPTLAVMAALTIGAAPAAAKHGNDHNRSQLEGRVLSVDSSARTFRLRDAERGTFTIYVTRSTEFERVSGFRALRAGKRIEVRFRRHDGRRVATKIESGGSNHS